jgi:hypothetical protein
VDVTSIAWFGAGALCSIFARWAFRLSFRDPVTILTVAAFVVGFCCWPLALFGGLMFFLTWAFSDPSDQRYMAVKWSKEWWQMRYRQHCFVRNLWYLGNPPKQEGFLSGWRDYHPE